MASFSPASGLTLIRARKIVTMAGEKRARGRALSQPLSKLDNGYVLCENGLVREIGISKKIPPRCRTYDLDDAILGPAFVNAHCHVSLSSLAGKTSWGKGFTAWLASLIPHMLDLRRSFAAYPQKSYEKMEKGIEKACRQLADAANFLVGDFGGSFPRLLSSVQATGNKYGLLVSHFCENFGFEKQDTPWPRHCRADLQSNPYLIKNCSPAGHALYSTSPDTMQKAKNHCKKSRRIFSFHLAESMEEVELLTAGKGGLQKIYAGTILPEDWHAPGLSPVKFAKKLALLDELSLAAHCVWLEDEEIKILAESGASVCLCPRSNANLATGMPRIMDMINSGISLCLGTDGLTSNSDLDVFNDAMFLREKGMPPETLLRLLTVNGAAALGKPESFAAIVPGAPARFSLLPNDFL